MNVFLDTVGQITHIASVGAHGIWVGALLAEGFLIVPYWRTLSEPVFYGLHPKYGPRLFRFFAPITVLVPLMWAVGAAIAWVGSAPNRCSMLSAAISSWAVLGMYFAYFRGVNDRFGRAALAPGALAGELRRWAVWHWVRTWIAGLGYVFGLLSLA